MRWLKRIVLSLVVLIVLAVVLASVAIAVDVATASGRVDAMTNTRIANANGPAVRAFVARPKTPGSHPAVIMVHEWWGLKPDIISKAEALAQEGYVVIAPDLFRGQSTSSILAAIYQVSTNSSVQVDSDLNTVLSWLMQQSDVQPDRIAIMGFCLARCHRPAERLAHCHESSPAPIPIDGAGGVVRGTSNRSPCHGSRPPDGRPDGCQCNS
jgi:carboxymethylenebutenolidase